jgi:hypothetical protein
MLWAGKHLATSLFDMWGEMQYFLIKVADQKDHKFLVRAKHGLLNPEAVCQAVRSDIEEISNESGLPSHSIHVSVLGSGLMRWKDDASVCIRPNTGSTSLSALDAAGLVASLLRQTMVVHMEVPTDFAAMESGNSSASTSGCAPSVFTTFTKAIATVPQTR